MSGRRESATVLAGRAMAMSAPALVLLVGLGGRALVQPQERVSLARPLSEFPSALAGLELSAELEVPQPEREALSADDLLYREYRFESGRPATIYVAWYGRQTGGLSIHSPANCLPGSGWEAVEADRVRTRTVYGPVEINRYLIEHGTGARALVYYWYQGRGRITASEYDVKRLLLRDALLERRTDEALVRLVLPLRRDADSVQRADALAAATVTEVANALARHLPGR
ncbi:MAG: EpsI family protein [Gemmatimonadota bacterium]|nr:EpsI family protein [Gemmatimonadota bacterium]